MKDCVDCGNCCFGCPYDAKQSTVTGQLERLSPEERSRLTSNDKKTIINTRFIRLNFYYCLHACLLVLLLQLFHSRMWSEFCVTDITAKRSALKCGPSPLLGLLQLVSERLGERVSESLLIFACLLDSRYMTRD